MEICRFDCAAMSSHFAEVEIRGEEMIPGDMSLTEVWKSRFERLAGQSTQIVIVDRYGCEPGPNMDGLRKLFILLDGTARNARISLFVGYGSRRGTTQSPNRSGIDLFQRVSDVVTPLSRGGVGSCCLYCVDDGTFELLSHNRFLRFDDAVCDIDVGVSLFGGIEGRLYRTSAFSMKHQCDDYRKTEEGLRRKADKYSGPIDVLGKRTESLPSVPQHEG